MGSLNQSNQSNDVALIHRELWYRGTPFHLFHSGQKDLLDILKKKDSFLAVINCSRQFGKTYWACVLAIMHCLTKPRNVVKYGSAYYTDLEKYIFPTFRKIIELMPIEIRPDIIESKKHVIFKNESIIDLCGLDLKPDGVRGNSVSLVILEEAGYIKKLRYIYFDVVLPMFMHTQKLNPKCVMLGTPSGDLTHDFTNFFFPKAKAERVYVVKTIDDNPMLSERERDRIKDEYLKDCTTQASINVQTAKRDRELYGKVTVDLEKAIIPEWEDKYINVESSAMLTNPMFVGRDEYFEFYHKYVSMDYGVGDKTVFLFYYYDFKNACVVYEGEFQDSGSSMTTDTLYAEVVSRETKLYEGRIYRRVADTTNLLLINDFTNKYKMPFLHVKKDLLHVMVNEARMWVKSGRIRVDPFCTELIGCLKHGMWNDAKTAFADSDLFGHYDALAAFVYSLRVIDQQTNPIPVTHGLSGDIMVKKNVKDSEFKKKMKSLFSSNR